MEKNDKTLKQSRWISQAFSHGFVWSNYLTVIIQRVHYSFVTAHFSSTCPPISLTFMTSQLFFFLLYWAILLRSLWLSSIKRISLSSCLSFCIYVQFVSGIIQLHINFIHNI